MDETDINQAWERFCAAMKALTGIEPSKGDSSATHHFRIWTIGYMAGISDSETKRRITSR